MTNQDVMALPNDFIARLQAETAINGEALIKAIASTPPTVGVRINPSKEGEIPFWLAEAQRVPWSRNGFYLDSRPSFTLTPALHAGGIYVQDPSSMIHEEIIARITDSDTPVRLLDLCAAPGGKTTAAIASLPSQSLVVANEIMPARAAILAENLMKWGYPNTIVTSTDAANLGNLRDTFDIIMVDAPCSGEGMMRKEVKAVQQWTPGLVESCALMQKEILDNALPALRSEGYLIYSTCTFSRQENEDMVEYLIDHYGLKSIDLGLDKFGIPVGWSHKAHTYRFMPHLTQGEGLFVAVLQKPQGELSTPKKNKKKEKHTTSKTFNIKNIPQWVEHQEAYTPVLVNDSIHLIPAQHLEVYDALRKESIRMLGAGIELGEIKRNDIVPAHALAMSTALLPDVFPNVELSEEVALNYLRRENISLPSATPKGFVTVCHGGRKLGFMKNIGNRANNLYPAQWRIKNK